MKERTSARRPQGAAATTDKDISTIAQCEARVRRIFPLRDLLAVNTFERFRGRVPVDDEAVAAFYRSVVIEYEHQRDVDYFADVLREARAIADRSAPVELTPEDRAVLDGLQAIDPSTYQLWEGKWRGRYASQSEADMGLLALLRYRYRVDRAQLRRLFLASGLRRSKTLSRRGSSTYLDVTLDKVMASEAQA